MKETINNIQTKLDHLYNRTQVNGIQSLYVELECKDRPFNPMWTFACSGPWPDLAQHQQPPGERRGQWTGRSGQGRRKPAEHSEGGDTDGAGEKGVSVLLGLPGEAQYVKIRCVGLRHKHYSNFVVAIFGCHPVKCPVAVSTVVKYSCFYFVPCGLL